MLQVPSRVGRAVAGHRQSAASWKCVRSSAWDLIRVQDRRFSNTSIRCAPASVIEQSLILLRG